MTEKAWWLMEVLAVTKRARSCLERERAAYKGSHNHIEPNLKAENIILSVVQEREVSKFK
jgi:hypothetical protein